MPNNRDPKWGAMKSGTPHMPQEWETMDASECHTSEKWIEQNPSSPRMSEKFVDMEAGEPKGNEWHEMKQEGRVDPYSMAPSEGDRSIGMKAMAKVKPDNKVGRATQHNEFGSTREI